jgi:hypothetical protein
MAGLVPAIHVFTSLLVTKDVDAGTGPGMTVDRNTPWLLCLNTASMRCSPATKWWSANC